MARMLQALKNLEARSVRPQTAQAVSAPSPALPPCDARELSDWSELNTGPPAETPSVAVAEEAIEAVELLPPAVDEPVKEDAAILRGVTTSIDFAATELAKLTIAVRDPTWQASGWGEAGVNVAALGAMVEDALGVQPAGEGRKDSGFGVQGSGERGRGPSRGHSDSFRRRAEAAMKMPR